MTAAEQIAAGMMHVASGGIVLRPNGVPKRRIMSFPIGVRRAQDINVGRSFPECFKRDGSFAVSGQCLVGHPDGLFVERASLPRPSRTGKGIRGVRNAGNGKLKAAAQADRERGNRGHIDFLTEPMDETSPTSRPNSPRSKDEGLRSYRLRRPGPTWQCVTRTSAKRGNGVRPSLESWDWRKGDVT